MLVNAKQCKLLAKTEKVKNLSKEYLDLLNREVTKIILISCDKAKKSKVVEL